MGLKIKSGLQFIFAFVLSTFFGSSLANATKMFSAKMAIPSVCLSRPSFVEQLKLEIKGGLKEIPAKTLVAREVEFWAEAENAGQPIQVHGYQSFLNRTQSSPRVLCGSGQEIVNRRFSMLAPTLIQSQGSANSKNITVWNFQMIPNSIGYQAWNLKSPILSGSKIQDVAMLDQAASYKWYQNGSKEYELLVTKTESGVKQYLRVQFDSAYANE